MKADVLIVSTSESSEATRRLELIADFMGLKSQVIAADALKPKIIKRAPQAGCIVAPADSLLSQGVLSSIRRMKTPLMIYGFIQKPKHIDLLKELSGGRISGIQPTNLKQKYVVSKNEVGITGEFSGLQFGPPSRLVDCSFLQRDTDNTALVTIDKHPFLTRASQGSDSNIYLLGCASVADIEAPAYTLPQLPKLFSSLVCYMQFMRAFNKDKCTLPANHLAAVVIDDPLLLPSYGCINYKQLLEYTHQHNYCVSIAHIPANAKRFSRETVRLFREHPDKFSLSIHGCNHLRGEFATTDSTRLQALTTCALSLMQKFSETTEIAWDNVMVFPHGLFSVEALEVLHKSEISAAAASIESFVPSHNPAGGAKKNRLRLIDFMQPAVTAYAATPLFLRRHPRNLENFAFDLFLGRPPIITTHHGSFCKNAEKLHLFIDRLNSLCNDLKWTSLANIVNSCNVNGGARCSLAMGSTYNACSIGRMTTFKSVIKRRLMTVRDNATALKRQ